MVRQISVLVTLLLFYLPALNAVGHSQSVGPTTQKPTKTSRVVTVPPVIVDTNSFDIPHLRTRLTAAISSDFEVVKDELKTRSNESGGGTYWLAHLKPKRSGYFVLTYRYNYNDSHYSHVERDFLLRIGPAGCRRGPPYSGSYARFCVGDTVIVPIVINTFTEHEFTLTSKPYTSSDDDIFEKERPLESDVKQGDEITNPASDMLRYVGRSSHRMLHRNGGYTLVGSATFVAAQPGRFNLVFGRAVAGDNVAGIPIIVVARGTPVTLLASRQDVRGYSRGDDGSEWVSSSSGDAFMSNVFILQPGDRVSFEYFSARGSAEFERAGGADEDKISLPVISKLPFRLDLGYDFTEWLADYLPR
jgi:hypothetical protein